MSDGFSSQRGGYGSSSRKPAVSTGPRTGPQGVTIQDVANVGAAGSVALPKTPRPAMPRPRMAPVGTMSTSDLIAQFVGPRLSTADKKYSGFSTEAQRQQAVIGQLAAVSALEELARAQAEQNQKALLEAFGERVAYGSPEVEATRARISDVLAQPIGGMTAVENLAAAQARYAPGRERLAEIEARLSKPAFQVPASERAALQAEARQLQSTLPAEQPIETARVSASDQARQDAYARAMERRNAVAFAAPTRNRAGNVIQPSWETVAQQQLRGELTPELEQQYGAQVAPSLQLANQLRDLPRAELAQQIATQQFGMDQALAAAAFGGDFERQQREREMAARNIFPNQSLEEIILYTQGEEALLQYQQDRLDAALAKQNEGFRTEEETALDLSIEQATGVPVDVAAGDYDRARARGYLVNPEFTSYLNQAREEIIASPATSMTEKQNVARQLAQDFYAQTGDPVAAQILLNALLSFDFTLSFQSAG